MKKFPGKFFAGFGLILLVASCAPPDVTANETTERIGLCGERLSDGPLEDFVIAHSGGLTFEPYVLWGIKEGCFSRHGLNATSSGGNSSGFDQLAALVGGSADVAGNGTHELLILDSALPERVKILSGGHSYSEDQLRNGRSIPFDNGQLVLQSALVVTGPVEFGDIAALEGLRVGVGSGLNASALGISRALRTQGLSSEDLELIELGSSERLAALLAGDLDGATLVGQDIWLALDAGFEVVLYPAAYFYGPGPATVWYTTDEKWQNDSKRFEAFRLGLWDTYSLLNNPANLASFKNFLVEDYGLSSDAMSNFELHTFVAGPPSFQDLQFYEFILKEEGLVPESYRTPSSLVVP